MKTGLVDNIKNAIESSPSIPDANTIDEKRSVYQDQYDQAALQNFLLNQSARTIYSHRIFFMTCGWLISVITILVLVGIKVLLLSDAVIIALLGTTTINVLGFFVIVTQYLFNKDRST